jgi:hypothetical protein
MTSSESAPDAEVNARLRELADIFAGALLRQRPRSSPPTETSPNLPRAAFSPVEVPPDTALSVPDGLQTRENQSKERGT